MATRRQMATNGEMSSGLDLRLGDTTDTPFIGCRTVASLGSYTYNLATGNSDCKRFLVAEALLGG